MKNFHSIETPLLSHTTTKDWELVYEPAEDTFFLLDVLEEDLGFIHLRKPRTVLEVGSGSGAVITGLARSLGSSSVYLALDINPHACRMTLATSTHNHTSVDVLQSDLLVPFAKGWIDLVVFNPPYVVTPPQEVTSKDALTKSWAGGEEGRQVIDRFLNQLDSYLSSSGFGYLLLIKENKPSEVITILNSMNFVATVVGERKIQGEQLMVVRFQKP